MATLLNRPNCADVAQWAADVVVGFSQRAERFRSFCFLPMFQLLSYRGIDAGWLPVGRPRPFDAACKLQAIAKRINGDVWSYRLKAIDPELPSFV